MRLIPYVESGAFCLKSSLHHVCLLVVASPRLLSCSRSSITPISSVANKELIWTFVHINKVIDHLTQLAWAGSSERNTFNLTSLRSYVLHQWNEIAITWCNNNCINFRGVFYGINGESYVPVCLLCSSKEYLKVLCFDLNTNLLKGLKERLFLACLCSDDVGYCSNKFAIPKCCFYDGIEINLCPINILCAVIEILCINKDSDTLISMFYNRKNEKL